MGIDSGTASELETNFTSAKDIEPSKQINNETTANASPFERINAASNALVNPHLESDQIELHLGEPQVQGFLAEIDKQIPLVESGALPLETFQAFLDQAKISGVPLEKLKSLLESRGISVKEAEGNQTETTDKQNESLLPSGKRASWIRRGAQLDQNGDFPLGMSIDTRMSRPSSQPFAGTTLETSNDMVNFGVNVPLEIDLEGRKIAKEEGDNAYYLDYVGEKLGWKKDSSGGWIIPKEQMETLTNEQAINLVKRTK